MFKGKSLRGANVTVIGKDAKFTGSLTLEGVLEVHGELIAEGTDAISKCTMVHLAKEAKVKGNICCVDLVVEGVIDGDIKATGSVKLLRGSKILGNIESGALTVEDGVYFSGGVQMIDSTKESKTPVTNKKLVSEG